MEEEAVDGQGPNELGNLRGQFLQDVAQHYQMLCPVLARSMLNNYRKLTHCGEFTTETRYSQCCKFCGTAWTNNNCRIRFVSKRQDTKRIPALKQTQIKRPWRLSKRQKMMLQKCRTDQTLMTRVCKSCKKTTNVAIERPTRKKAKKPLQLQQVKKDERDSNNDQGFSDKSDKTDKGNAAKDETDRRKQNLQQFLAKLPEKTSQAPQQMQTLSSVDSTNKSENTKRPKKNAMKGRNAKKSQRQKRIGPNLQKFIQSVL